MLNAFGLAFGGLLLLGGRLGDMLGQVRAFRAGLAVFVVASLLGGLATSPSMLIAARVLQGIGAALGGPSVLALVMVMARDSAEQARGMSLFIAVWTIHKPLRHHFAPIPPLVVGGDGLNPSIWHVQGLGL